MTDINLTALSLVELKKLEKDVGKAIASFEDRQIAQARLEAEAVARKFGYSLEVLAGTASAKKSTPVAPKYQHPENHALTWSGRGRKPGWLVSLLESGKSIEDFAI
ncbi:H-NS histone family protein [Ketogulonicigenium vulgare]|uniref:H-NS histone family protein n=1 Tax=Ketogulonicigenium vulgare TaxID=92945 RepID=UPI00235980A9|nr:H-NS histone family protein [Ketogulonicigenium vulgare]